MSKPVLPPLTPLQRKLRYGHNAEIALWRTTLQFAQTAEMRARAMQKLRELGVDPQGKGSAR